MQKKTFNCIQCHTHKKNACAPKSDRTQKLKIAHINQDYTKLSCHLVKPAQPEENAVRARIGGKKKLYSRKAIYPGKKLARSESTVGFVARETEEFKAVLITLMTQLSRPCHAVLCCPVFCRTVFEIFEIQRPTWHLSERRQKKKQREQPARRLW